MVADRPECCRTTRVVLAGMEERAWYSVVCSVFVCSFGKRQ